jgi:hypothetical protein
MQTGMFTVIVNFSGEGLEGNVQDLCTVGYLGRLPSLLISLQVD